MTRRDYYAVWKDAATADQYARIALTDVGLDALVSTVWLGFDHSLGAGRPLIFETMIFGGACAGYQWRWSTEREARESHEIIVRRLRAGQSLEDL